MPILTSQVVRCEALNDFVFQVTLQLPEPVNLQAGQYLMVAMGATDLRPFSIASAPAMGGNTQVELHIGATPENPYAWEVIETIRATGEVTVHLPAGTATYVAESERPILLLAGGTGFSYTWSLLQHHINSSSKRPLTLFWAVRKEKDLYLHEQVERLVADYEHIRYIPVVEEQPTEITNAVHAQLIPAVINSGMVLGDHDVYIAGRFEMVAAARTAFSQAGLPNSQLFGDALAFI